MGAAHTDAVSEGMRGVDACVCVRARDCNCAELMCVCVCVCVCVCARSCSVRVVPSVDAV